jgi:hypothetical protein
VDYEDGTSSLAGMEFADLLSEPRAYEAIVEAMPHCPAKVLLQALGYAYGLYPARAARTRLPGRDATLVLHVEAAPTTDLTFAYKDTANAHLKESPAERVRAAPARKATK